MLGLLAVTTSASRPDRPSGQTAPPSVDPNLQLSWLSHDADATTAVAWGDVDNDGDLDLAVGNKGAPNRVILNQDGVLSSSSEDDWVAAKAYNTTSLAWGDVDSDGDLDLVVGNEPEFEGNARPYDCTGGQEQLYRNDKGKLAKDPIWSSTLCDATSGVALGDMNDDGKPDLAVSNYRAFKQCPTLKDCTFAKNLVYLNDGRVFNTEPDWVSNQPGDFYDPAWGDVEGDGDLDLAVASGKGIYLYLNDAGKLRTSPDQILALELDLRKLEWGNLNGKPSAGCGKPGLDLVAAGPSGTVAFTNNCGKFADKPTWSDTASPPIEFFGLG